VVLLVVFQVVVVLKSVVTLCTVLILVFQVGVFIPNPSPFISYVKLPI